jgi:catechol 2,3-dioxygenase-like lactoylglutathione lyase family enzyme
VSIEVRPADVDACVAFYELLGFARVDPPPTLRDRAVWVERDGTQVHLMLIDDPVVPPHGHLAVVAEDYDATMARLRGAGFETDPRREHWGAPRSFVRDPSGARVEVMAAPPPASAPAPAAAAATASAPPPPSAPA